MPDLKIKALLKTSKCGHCQKEMLSSSDSVIINSLWGRTMGKQTFTDQR